MRRAKDGIMRRCGGCLCKKIFRKCGGHLMAHHPKMIDVFAAIIQTLKFVPSRSCTA
jgi:hypothetical protein